MTDAPTPAAGGCYYADPKTGELRRDGKTPQTREPDVLVEPSAPKEPKE